LEKNSLHPIYISLGNIPTWRRNKEDAKEFLGYLPILSANEIKKKSLDYKILVRETFHKSIKFLLNPLFCKESENGIDFEVNGENVWFFPRISTIISDWPEACTFALTYKSANSNYPCHFCLTEKDKFIKTHKDQMIMRNHETMYEYYQNNKMAEISLEPVYNFFWNVP
jgi:Plavaka transposase